MGKFFLRFFLVVLIVVFFATIFLIYFGLKTDKFDNLIKSKANEVNSYVKLDFQKTKIHLNPTELNLVVKLQKPKILVKDNEIILSKLDLFLPIRAFITSDFILKRVEISFAKNDIKDLTKITNIFLPKIINKKLNKIFYEGKLEGEFIIPFDKDGKIERNYGFSGKVSNAIINLTKEFSIKNLTTEVIHTKEEEANRFQIIINEGSIYDLALADSKIDLKREKNKIMVESLLHTSGKLNFSQVKKISSIAGLNIENFKDINGIADLKTNISFNLNKQFRLENLSYATQGDISYFEIHTKEKENIKKYLPEYDPKIILKDSHIQLTNSKTENKVELNGYIKTKDHFDSFEIYKVYNYNKKKL